MGAEPRQIFARQSADHDFERPLGSTSLKSGPADVVNKCTADNLSQIISRRYLIEQ